MRYVKERFEKIHGKNKASEMKNTKLFTSLLLQYVAAMIQKFQEKHQPLPQFNPMSILGPFLQAHLSNDSTTTKMISRIDRDNQKGHMILVRWILHVICNSLIHSYLTFRHRIVRGVDGKLFCETLRRVRDILGFNETFSVLLDIEGSKQDGRLYEEQFLPRLRK